MEVSINIGKEGEDEFLEIEKREIDSLDDLLAGKNLVNLIREKQEDENIDVLRTIFDQTRNMLFVWIDTVEVAQQRAKLERANRWGDPDQWKNSTWQPAKPHKDS